MKSIQLPQTCFALTLAFLVLATFSSPAQQLINAQFGPTAALAPPGLTAYVGPGPVGSSGDYWNPLTEGNNGYGPFTFGPLYDTTGTNITTVNITVSANGVFTGWGDALFGGTGSYANLRNTALTIWANNNINISGDWAPLN